MLKPTLGGTVAGTVDKKNLILKSRRGKNDIVIEGKNHITNASSLSSPYGNSSLLTSEGVAKKYGPDGKSGVHPRHPGSPLDDMLTRELGRAAVMGA